MMPRSDIIRDMRCVSSIDVATSSDHVVLSARDSLLSRSPLGRLLRRRFSNRFRTVGSPQQQGCDNVAMR